MRSRATNVTLQTLKTKFCNAVPDATTLHPSLLTHWLVGGDEPQMLIRGDNCCRNNYCCSTGKLPEFTQYSYINVMLLVGVVDSE